MAAFSDGTRRGLLRRIGAGATIGTGALTGCTSPFSRNQNRETSEPPETTPSSSGQESDSNNLGGVGIYLGDDTALTEWESWFGRKVDYYSFALFGDSWEDYQFDNWPLEIDIETITADRRAVISFDMYPDGKRLAQVRDGEFDRRYKRLARDLVEHGLSSAHLRFAWEFNGRWAETTAVGRPEMWVEAWKRVVESMRSVEGAAFEFVWAPNIWRHDMDPRDAYPGDDWIDKIGLTFYDKGDYYPFPENCDSTCVRRRRLNTWEDITGGRGSDLGLNFWAGYAREHGKSLVFPEYSIIARDWAVPGGGDNPLFFKKFQEWLQANRAVVDWHSLWSWTDGPHFVGPAELKTSNEYPAFPDASETFRNLFA